LARNSANAGSRAGQHGIIVNDAGAVLLDAIRALEEGVGSIEDIDNSMKLGCGHPMGPLTLLDFCGTGYDLLHFADYV